MRTESNDLNKVSHLVWKLILFCIILASHWNNSHITQLHLHFIMCRFTIQERSVKNLCSLCGLCADVSICCIPLCIHPVSHPLWHGTVGFLFPFFFFSFVRWIHRTVSSPISVFWACKSALSVQFEQSGPGAMYSSGHLNIPAVAKWHRAQASRLR